MAFRLLPTPQQIAVQPGSISIADVSRIEADADFPAALRARLDGFFAARTGTVLLRLRHDNRIVPEGYDLLIQANAITLAAADERGFRYGVSRIEQMCRNGRIHHGEIHDYPSLPLRGMHWNLHGTSHLPFEQELSLLDSMARWNMNTVVLEYDDRFPYRKQATLPGPCAYRRDHVCTLVARAKSLGLDVIPLQQCLGHLNFVLRHEAYAHLREEEERKDQWCPLRPQSLDLFCELVDEVVETHRPAKYVHIGGDETRRLGVCPRCAEVSRTRGKGRLYVDFVAKAAEHVIRQGLTPIVWDDMVCAHIEALDDLPRAIVLMYWDYWTVSDPSPMFVARPEGHPQVVDRRWAEEWRQELNPVEQRMIDVFARRLDLEKDLSPAFLARFRKYLGPHFPKRVRAFPYLEYYQDRGFRVICAGTASGNTSSWRGLPDLPRYAANLEVFARRAAEARALGLVSTMWYPMPYETYLAGIAFAGQSSWNTAVNRTPDKGLGPD